MNEAATQYRRAVRKHLRCGRAAKQRLEEHLTGLLNAFLEENPTPDRAALEAAFGTPEELAATLMEELTPEERGQWKKQKLAVRVVLVLLLAVVAVYTIGTFIYRSIPNEITVYEFTYPNGDEFYVPDSVLADSSASSADAP
ncbi:MAG: periplasmic heavy metal sensor [Clostridiales bacterium]|nr:periplasmic heavy metal sensor [Clostridiales bacterium]